MTTPMTGTTREEADLTPDQIVARADILFNQHRAMLTAMVDGRGTFSDTLHTELMLALQEAWPHVRAPSPSPTSRFTVEPSIPQDGFECWFIRDAAGNEVGTINGPQSSPTQIAAANAVAGITTPPSPSAGREEIAETIYDCLDGYVGGSESARELKAGRIADAILALSPSRTEGGQAEGEWPDKYETLRLPCCNQHPEDGHHPQCDPSAPSRTAEEREALLPFANLANAYDDELDSDDRPVGPIALKFCRSARAALRPFVAENAEPVADPFTREKAAKIAMEFSIYWEKSISQNRGLPMKHRVEGMAHGAKCLAARFMETEE